MYFTSQSYASAGTAFSNNALATACSLAAPCEYVGSDICYESSMADKPLVWLEGEIKTPPFSAEARIEAGGLLRRLQRGDLLSMPESRPMPSIGPNCHELRIPDREITWRIAYHVARDAIVILEVFGKKSRTTPKYVIKSARERLKAYKRAMEGN